jgi:hypothetical protein
MSIIKAKAEAVAENLSPRIDGKPSEVFLDPVTIGVIVQVITGVIRLYQECQKAPTEAAFHMKNPGWLTRRKLWRLVKEHVPADQDRESVYDEVIKSGRMVTPEEVDEMYREVQAG